MQGGAPGSARDSTVSSSLGRSRFSPGATISLDRNQHSLMAAESLPDAFWGFDPISPERLTTTRKSVSIPDAVNSRGEQSNNAKTLHHLGDISHRGQNHQDVNLDDLSRRLLGIQTEAGHGLKRTMRSEGHTPPPVTGIQLQRSAAADMPGPQKQESASSMPAAQVPLPLRTQQQNPSNQQQRKRSRIEVQVHEWQ